MNKAETENIEYLILRSKQSFLSAQVLAEIEIWNDCVNRLYYSCYYIVSALLFKNKIKTKTHSGLSTEFARHFVKTGKVSKENEDIFTDLLRSRFKGDYGNLFIFDEETIKPLFPQVKKFLNDIEKLINEK